MLREMYLQMKSKNKFKNNIEKENYYITISECKQVESLILNVV